MTEKEYKQLFLDPRFNNLSHHSTKDRLIYLVQQYQDVDLQKIIKVPFKLSGILFESDETLFGLKEIDMDKNMSYAVHLYTMKEFVFALHSGDREAILMLLDKDILSNTCGKKFIKGLLDRLDVKNVARYSDEYLQPKWEQIIKEKLYETLSLEEIIFDAYNDIKAYGILLDAMDKVIDNLYLSIHSKQNKYFFVNFHVRNTLEIIKGAKNSKTVALAMASFLSNHFFSEGITILANRSLNNFLIDFLKTNLNKKRKMLYLTDIKCEEEDING